MADLFDMRLFEEVRPGMTPADFRNRYGSSQFHGARAVLEVREEHDGDTLGTVTFRPVYAYPSQSQGGAELDSVLSAVVVHEIRRSRFGGELILAAGDGERMFCQVSGGKISQVRWI
jgi:hypothetical protein